MPSAQAGRGLSIFSSSSRQWPQLAMGVQVLSLPGCCCKSKVAMLRLDSLVSIRCLAVRSALSQYGTVITHRTTSQTHSPASGIHGQVSWPKSWHNSLTSLVKAGIYSLYKFNSPYKDARLNHANSLSVFSIKVVSLVMLGTQKLPEVQRCPRTCQQPGPVGSYAK